MAGLTTNRPQAAGILSGQEQGHLPKTWAGLRAGPWAAQVHWDNGVGSLAPVLAASTEGAVPGLPQGPRHARAVSASCSGGQGGTQGTEVGGKTQTIPGLTFPGTLTIPKADLEGGRWASAMGGRWDEETLG